MKDPEKDSPCKIQSSSPSPGDASHQANGSRVRLDSIASPQGDQLARLQVCALRLGLEFQHLGLLRTALTLRSWVNEHKDSPWQSNGRLEYLGDAVLDLAVAEHLYLNHPDVDEGELTKMRSGLVSRQALAQVAKRWDLGAELFVGSGDESCGARQRQATLSDALEAVLAALYLDARLSGRDAIEVVARAVAHLWGPRLREISEHTKQDPRSALQVAVQGALHVTPRYHYRKLESGAVRCEVRVEHCGTSLLLGHATRRHQRAACVRAAQHALDQGKWRQDLHNA